MTRATAAGLAAVAVAAGIAAEPFGAGLGWLPDLATGWALAAAGVAAAWLVPTSAAGPLLALTGALWFAANFVGAPDTDYLYRAPLVLAVLGASAGGLKSRPRTALVAGVALAAALPFIARDLPATAALAAVILAVGIAAPVTLPGAAVLAGSLAGAGIAVHSVAPGTSTVAVLAAFGAGLTIAATLTVASAMRDAAPDVLVDRLVAHAHGTVGAFREALADAVGDQTIEVRFTGDPDVAALQPGLERTVVDGHTAPIATLIHRTGSLDDPQLRAAVTAATRLQGVNVALQRDLVAQADAIEASGRRLLAAGDEQRRRLGRRVAQGPIGKLETLADRLGPLPGDPVARARETLAASLEELRELAIGLHPGAAADHDLPFALHTLARRVPLPVSVSADLAPAVPDEIRTALLFTCSEALANVAKHAHATHAELRLEGTPGAVTLTVADDGRGGADPAAGSGLRGLQARIALLDGTLAVDSDAGRGTRLSARFPLPGAAA